MENVIGTSGNDTLTGGLAADTFVFTAGDGSDRITDFARAQDKIEFHGLGLALSDLTIAEVGADTIISYGDSDLTLVGLRSVATSDYLFT